MASCSERSLLVLVAVDGSEFSDRALLFYLKRVHKEEYRVGLIHSYEKPDLVIRAPVDIVKLNVEEIEKTFRSSWDKADKIMERYKKICQEYGVGKVHEFLEHGKKPGEAICAVAERENPFLIVVGTRGQSVMRRTVLGSVSDYVVKHSVKVATLVVP
ncbi:uncharacterized protein LOC114518889 [Dendronephthya gigantea]|uniref:uncharacterized protein LOC114518889 n=1 Tax=Dendronephthya gigantea TaxID=151771 RepID=UPI00106CB3B0|nr:uncharacterized protein LOC114518889 [Dendronephthya gigantea]